MIVIIHEPNYGGFPEKEHTFRSWDGEAPRIGDIVWLDGGDYRITERHWNPGARPMLHLYVEYVKSVKRET